LCKQILFGCVLYQLEIRKGEFPIQVHCGHETNVPQVGGLPLVELNHLELQFLLLNDFRLAVPLEEMEAYGTMLVEFYAREVAEQHERQAGRA
jgi:hypothetical protein